MGMRIKLHSTDHPNNLLKELNKCRLSETMCDVTIVVGNRSYAAHKAILACASGYFQNLFLNTGLDAARTYVVDFITPANFEKILNFIYTSELFTDLINVGVIYEVAEKLGMEGLLKACHATFPDLENSAVAKYSLASNESRSGALSSVSIDPSHSVSETRGGGDHFSSDRNYITHLDGMDSYKAEEKNPSGEANQSMPLPFQLPTKTEQDEPAPFPSPPNLAAQTSGGSLAIQTTTSSCQTFKIQSNGDYSKNSFLAVDAPLGSSAGSNSCTSIGEQCKDQSFGPMDELQLDELEEEELHFEDPVEDLGPAGEVIELSDGSEDELVFGEATSGRENKAMPCQVCKKVLEPNLQLIRQHAREHVDLQTGNCKVCKTHFHDHSSRVTHVLSHVGIFLFSCDMCETKFFTQWQLALHRKEGVSDHNVVVRPSDPLPGEINSFNGGTSTELTCAACRKMLFRDFHTLRGHILEHVNLKAQACGVCDRRHPNLCSLMWHTLSHMDISVFSCAACASSFLDRGLLEKHLAVHRSIDSSLFCCHLCGQSFRSDVAYHCHISQHKCDGLEERRGFGDQQHNTLQKRKVPGEFLSEDIALQTQTTHTKYSCKVCGKRFSHTSEFNYHRRIHTGEKPYQCKVCHKFFRGRSTIKCHLKTHSGALMYRCTVCGHYSSTLNLMSKHIGIHRGSLPADFTIEQTFMYIIHSKEVEKATDS
ncbi:zinc finger and BTB domain-containing protein 39 [Microcaecilia unicolor]|uniref:Zinc finger and BTB domain-containing protein 39 n=1 Tax=Microcaecilia unicolor TaxID=1415580 RepID=A0A6P7XAB2_9AMPH|nr:zinc finger and BTB domain-containing protein 39 [Microcaecilia unicolor]